MDFLNQTSGARTQEIAFCGKIGYTPFLFHLPLLLPQTTTFKFTFCCEDQAIWKSLKRSCALVRNNR